MPILLGLLLATFAQAQSVSPTPSHSPSPTPSNGDSDFLISLCVGTTAVVCGCWCICLYKYLKKRSPQQALPPGDIIVLSQENFNSLLKPQVAAARNPDAACSVCLENARTVAFITCGHSVCEECNLLLLKENSPCPLCRLPIESRLHLY